MYVFCARQIWALYLQRVLNYTPMNDNDSQLIQLCQKNIKEFSWLCSATLTNVFRNGKNETLIVR